MEEGGGISVESKEDGVEDDKEDEDGLTAVADADAAKEEDEEEEEGVAV